MRTRLAAGIDGVRAASIGTGIGDLHGHAGQEGGWSTAPECKESGQVAGNLREVDELAGCRGRKIVEIDGTGGVHRTDPQATRILIEVAGYDLRIGRLDPCSKTSGEKERSKDSDQHDGPPG